LVFTAKDVGRKIARKGQPKKDRKIAKKIENSTIKPLSVSCMKIEGGMAPLPTPMFTASQCEIQHKKEIV